MKNTLYRVQQINRVAAVPPTPGRDAYSYQQDGEESKFVCDVWESGETGGTYDKESRRCLKGHTEKVKTTKTVTVPATPGTPGTPGSISFDPVKGWTSRAISIPSFESLGYAEFSVPNNVTGVVAGLATYLPPANDVSFGHIAHGVLFTDNKAFSARTGAALGPYGTADVWRVRAARGQVEIYRNGVLKIQEPSDAFQGARVHLASSLYWMDSYITDPKIVSEYVAAIAGEMPMPEMRIWATDSAEISATMPMPTMRIVVPPGIYAEMPMAEMRIWAARHAEIIATMPMPVMTITGGFPQIVEQGYIVGMMPMPVMNVMTEAPYEAWIVADMPAPVAQLIAGDIAVIYGEMPTPTMRVTTRAPGTLVLEEIGLAAPRVLPFGAVLMRLAARGRVGSAMVAGALAEMLLEASGVVSDTLSFDGVVEMVLEAIGRVGGLPIVPDTSETWVYGTETGGTTRYTFGCNSFAKIGDKYYGASAAGIHLLEGDTDDGKPIQAAIGFGTPKFGTSALKGLTDCYVGMSSSGHLYLRVTANCRTYTYRTRAFDRLMKEQRIDCGLGLRATVFGLELVNQGADFDLESIEFRVVPLSRRIQS